MPRIESPAVCSANHRKIGAHRTRWTVGIALALGLVACSVEDPESGDGTGGTASSAGTVGVAGAPAAGTTSTSAGSSTVTGGGSTGGAASTAGAMTGGAAATGGSVTGGAGPTGGAAPKGGAANGGAAATGGAMTGGAAGAGSGTCQKGSTMGKEVLFIGESFVAASSIPEETTKLARAAGSLTANDSYVDKSVSGTWIGNGAANSIPAQYTSNSSGVRFVLMNGGGNDCWQGGQESHRTAALDAAKKLFQDMGAKGVKKIVYFFYPDPIGSQFADLTACLNLLRPAMKTLCDAQTSPKCHWVDLRDTWKGHAEYTSDGIHVAGPGNAPTAAAIFKSMTDNCVAP